MYNTADGTHFNNIGHSLTAYGIVSTLVTQVFANGQSLATSGDVEFLDLIVNTKNVLPDAEGNILGIDSTGKIGLLNAIKVGMKINSPVLLNGLTQLGALLPSVLNSNSIYLAMSTLLSASHINNPDWYGSMELCDTGASMCFRVSYPLGQFRFFNHDGTVLACSINGSGNLVMGSAEVGTAIFGDIWIPTLAGLGASIGGIEGKFIPLDSSNSAVIKNDWSQGNIKFKVSGGVNSNEVIALQTNSHGRTILQVESYSSDFSDLIKAKLALNSDTEGFLMPRMTSTQRDTMGYLTLIGVSAFGSGYTTGTIAITGGGGTGATATPIFDSTGRFQGATITNPGSGYISVPTITITGDGTGASAEGQVSISLSKHEGLQIYNLDTHKINFYNGDSWLQLTNTVA